MDVPAPDSPNWCYDGDLALPLDLEIDPLPVAENSPSNRNDPNSSSASKPYVGMKFGSHEEAYDFYNAYALMVGFGIRRSTTNYGRDGVVHDKKFVCSKEGQKTLRDKREVGKMVNRRRDTRVGCMALLKIKLCPDNTWVVIAFVEAHTNHEMISPNKAKMHRSQQQYHRTKRVKNLIDSMTGEGVAPSVITRVINATSGSTDETVTTQQCIDHIRTNRKNNIGHECVAIIQHFVSKASNDPEFYFAMEVDSTGKLRSVFWADGRARAAYLKFSDVVVFDVTYRTNKFNLPFALFTGVNHHRQSTLFGCALLADEQEETFVWLFQEWLKCMHGMEPGAIITDQDRAICNALHIVLPKTRHRYCYWHLQKHIPDHLASLCSLYGEEFREYYNMWYCSDTIEKSNIKWVELKEKFKMTENDEGWLQTMYSYRDHWVPCYLNDIFFAGMSSSQRSESINAFFDSFVHSNTQLPEFVGQYDKAIDHRRASEAHEDFITLNSKPHMHLFHPIEEQAGECYTRRIFDLFQYQLKRCGSLFREELRQPENIVLYKVGKRSTEKNKWKSVVYDLNVEPQLTCSCKMFETSGILCKHILYIMQHLQMESIPSYFILHRWTIHARHRNIGVDNIVMGNSAEQVNLLQSWALRAKFNNALERSFKSIDRMRRLDVVLEEYLKEDDEEFGQSGVQGMETTTQATTHAGSSHMVDHIPQISIRDPVGPARTKGRPRGASRFKSSMEEAQEKKDKQKRVCGRCGQLGHYRSTCTNPPSNVATNIERC